ncbi:hypothetical protein AB0L13_38800 [Saccharopolyspora shandongensis]
MPEDWATQLQALAALPSAERERWRRLVRRAAGLPERPPVTAS